MDFVTIDNSLDQPLYLQMDKTFLMAVHLYLADKFSFAGFSSLSVSDPQKQSRGFSNSCSSLAQFENYPKF